VAQLTKQTFSAIVWIVRRWCPVAEAVQADCSTQRVQYHLCTSIVLPITDCSTACPVALFS